MTKYQKKPLQVYANDFIAGKKNYLSSQTGIPKNSIIPHVNMTNDADAENPWYMYEVLKPISRTIQSAVDFLRNKVIDYAQSGKQNTLKLPNTTTIIPSSPKTTTAGYSPKITTTILPSSPKTITEGDGKTVIISEKEIDGCRRVKITDMSITSLHSVILKKIGNGRSIKSIKEVPNTFISDDDDVLFLPQDAKLEITFNS